MTHDEMLERRELISRLVSLGKRVGYGLFALAMVLFFYGLATRYDPWITTAIKAAMLIGSIVLAPAIVFGYGVKAAIRHEREEQAELERRNVAGGS